MSSYKGQRPPQQAVRVGTFERALEAHDAEIGQKVAGILSQYNRAIIVPLDERLTFLETVTGIRLFRRVAAWFRR